MAAVMLMTMPSRSLMLPEPSAGITRIGTTIANCSQAARHGMPSSLSSTSLPPKMPLGISEKKIFTGVEVHISSEPRVAASRITPTTRVTRPAERPKYSPTAPMTTKMPLE